MNKIEQKHRLTSDTEYNNSFYDPEGTFYIAPSKTVLN